MTIPSHPSLIVTLAAVSALAMASACDADKASPGPQSPQGEAEAPDFELPAPSGDTVRLSDYRGKVVLLDFWASWCSPCKQEMPVLESLYTKYSDKGLVIVGVNLDEEKGDAMGFLEATQVTFPVGLDPQGRIAEMYAPPKMPTSYVIDPDGKIVHINAGYEGDDAATIEQQLVALLGE